MTFDSENVIKRANLLSFFSTVENKISFAGIRKINEDVNHSHYRIFHFYCPWHGFDYSVESIDKFYVKSVQTTWTQFYKRNFFLKKDDRSRRITSNKS